MSKSSVDLSLSQRLLLLKRLMGLRTARFSVAVGEDDSLHIVAAMVDDEPQSQDSDGVADGKGLDEVPTLIVGSVSYRIPELLDRELKRGEYFG